MKKVLGMMLVLVMLVSVLSSCGGGTSSDTNKGKGTYKDSLAVAVEMDQCLNPWINGNTGSLHAAVQMFDSLVILGEDGKVTPCLVKEWQNIDDTHIKLSLREDVTFHDGSKFTAEDVMFFFENLGTFSTLASRYAYVDVPNCKINSDYEFMLALKKPYAEAVIQLAWAYIIPKKAYETMGQDAFGNAPVGSGPYKFVSWTPGSEVKLERYDSYWGEAAQTKNLTLKVIPDASSRVVELETGGVDFIMAPGTANLSRIKDTDGIHAEVGESPRYILLTFSMKDEMLMNKDVRYALCYAIDRKALVDACYEGYAYTMDTMWPKGLFGAKSLGNDAFEYNLDKAKELMKKAGYENGFEIELQVVGDEEKALCEAIQNMWSKINVKTKIVQMGYVNYEAAGNKYQAAVRSGAATNLSNCIIIYKSSFGRTLQVNDQWLDENIQLSDTITDENERQKLLYEIQDHLYDIRYSMPLANTPMSYAMSDKVEGFGFRSVGLPYFNTVKVAE